MPRNGSGVFSPSPANYPAVSATTITAANRNAIDADIATALTNSIAVNGESVVTADIAFGNNKLTGVKDGTLGKDAANVSQIQNSNAILLASVAGTDTITASLSPALTAYANGQIFTLIPANNNTGAVTININGLGAKALTKNGATALVAGDLVAGVEYSLQYDGTRFQKVAGSDYAKSGVNSDITSLTAVTAITAATVTVSPGDLAYVKDISAADELKVVTTQSIADLNSIYGDMRLTTGQGIPIGDTKLNMNVAGASSGVTMDTANKRITIVTNGNYEIFANAAVFISGIYTMSLSIYKNGVSAAAQMGSTAAGATYSSAASVSVILSLVAGDYIEAYAYVGATSTVSSGNLMLKKL